MIRGKMMPKRLNGRHTAIEIGVRNILLKSGVSHMTLATANAVVWLSLAKLKTYAPKSVHWNHWAFLVRESGAYCPP